MHKDDLTVSFIQTFSIVLTSFIIFNILILTIFTYNCLTILSFMNELMPIPTIFSCSMLEVRAKRMSYIKYQ